MKKVLKLAWMALFALPMIGFTACGDDDELIDDNTGSKVELKDYSDLIGKKYNEVIEKLGSNFDKTETDQYQIVYKDFDSTIEEIDVDFTFYVENEDGEIVPITPIPYEKAVYVDVDVRGFSNEYLVNRMQELYGKGDYNEADDEIWYTYEKDGKRILYEFDEEDQIGEITYVDKKEFDNAFPETKGDNGRTLKALKDLTRNK